MFLRHNLLWMVWVALIILMSVAPGSDIPIFKSFGFLSIDKIAHLFLYSLLSILMLTGFNKQFTYPFLKNRALYIVFGFGITLGTVLEIIQEHFIKERGFEWLDVAANISGLGMGAVLFFMIYKNCLVRN